MLCKKEPLDVNGNDIEIIISKDRRTVTINCPIRKSPSILRLERIGTLSVIEEKEKTTKGPRGAR